MTAPVQPQQGAPAIPAPPPPTAMRPPVMPWTPFTPMPTDSEPLIAAMRQRRLGKLIDSAKFEAMPKEWQQVAILEYQRMQQIVVAAQPAPPLPKGVVIQGKAQDAQGIASQELAATKPQSVQQPQKPQQAPQQPPGVR